MITKEIYVRELSIDDINENLLKFYSRFQEVNKVWRVENNRKVIKDISFIEDWDYEEKQAIIKALKETILDDGAVFGVFEAKKLKAFASISGTLLGENKEYLQLLQLHVSNDLRGKGIGKMLFQSCIEKAKELEAVKLYISAHSSIETMSFYTRMGCVDAKWLYKYQVEIEPCDCQLEYVF